MNPDVNQVAAIVTAAVALSGAALQWASAIAARKGAQHAATRDQLAETRTDREAIIDQLQEDVERYRGWLKESEDRRQTDLERYRAEVDAMEEKAHQAIRQVRECRVRVFDLEMALRDLDPHHPLLGGPGN